MRSDKVYRKHSCQVEIWALPPGNTLYHPSFRKYFHRALISESDKAAKGVHSVGFDNMLESGMLVTTPNY